MGLHQLAFTEHSGQLYYDGPTYWGGGVAEHGLASRAGWAERMADYWQAAAQHRGDTVFVGLEVDADFVGNLVAAPADLDQRIVTAALDLASDRGISIDLPADLIADYRPDPVAPPGGAAARLQIEIYRRIGEIIAAEE